MAKTSEMDLRDYGRILMRRKWWVLGAIVCGAGLAMVLNTVTDPVYRATARIQISREPSRSLLTGEMLDNPTDKSDNLALYTAAELITNRKLLTRVVASLREQGVIAGDEKPARPWYRSFLGGSAATASVAQLGGATTDAGDPMVGAVPQSQVEWLLGHISVEPVRDTRLVNIHVEHSKPRSAEQIANAVADMFVQYQVEQRTAGSSNLVTYLTDQIQEVRQSLQKAEAASAHVKARGDRQGAEDRYQRLRMAAESRDLDVEHLPVRSGTLDALKKQLIDSETELAKARQIYRDRHPRLVMLESENASIRASIRSELADAVATARTEFNMARERERSVSGSSSSGSTNLATLESEVANQRELYNALLTKLKEAEITGQARGPLVEVVEPATADRSPVRPRKVLNLIVCLFAGLTIGTGLAFLREYLRRTIRTPQDVDDYLQLPVLGLIPKA